MSKNDVNQTEEAKKDDLLDVDGINDDVVIENPKTLDDAANKAETETDTTTTETKEETEAETKEKAKSAPRRRKKKVQGVVVNLPNEDDEDIFAELRGEPVTKKKPKTVLTSVHLDEDLYNFIEAAYQSRKVGERHGYKSKFINRCIRETLKREGLIVKPANKETE